MMTEKNKNNRKNRKIRRVLKGLLCFIAGAVLGLFFFAPWEDVAQWTIAKISKEVSFRGVRLEVGSVSSEGALNPRFLFGRVKLSSEMASSEISWIEVDPEILKSLVSGRIHAMIRTGEGRVENRLTGVLGWRSASVDIITDGERGKYGKSVSLSNISVNGTNVAEGSDKSFSAAGSIDISSNGKIIRSDILLNVPDRFDRMLKAISMSGPLSLEKMPSGEWRIKK